LQGTPRYIFAFEDNKKARDLWQHCSITILPSTLLKDDDQKMPFTPFHFGPALGLGLPFRKYLSSFNGTVWRRKMI
jgi:hypothetical protein